ncbi:YfkD famly protein [Oceanobacillus sp. Castelsardo]|uniref:YfkD famly protein n=1 Tax=Oceanobacillus sp. Castelsardo TaxID=1851204 RepID=UPI0008395BC5|nr:YfkD famly protein [Oceanobacillus sp. Castelsardo]
MKVRILTILVACLYALVFPVLSSAEEQKDDKKSKDPFEIPSHVLDISKENTYPNTTEDQEVIEPSELTKELMDGTDIPIKNPDLIKMLNESALDPSPIAIGYRGMIYLGRWPLNYESLETNINWEYQKINTNELNNLGGDVNQVMNYVQQEQKEIKGALTNKINNPDEVKRMMLLATKEKTKLPLSYQTVIGKNTKKENSYNIPTEKFGVLNAFAPAVNEKGQVTFGEVYIKLKGSNKGLIIKNVTKQGIGGWIPIQDHVSFSFQIK